jgi:hypothetical protein
MTSASEQYLDDVATAQSVPPTQPSGRIPSLAEGETVHYPIEGTTVLHCAGGCGRYRQCQTAHLVNGVVNFVWHCGSCDPKATRGRVAAQTAATGGRSLTLAEIAEEMKRAPELAVYVNGMRNYEIRETELGGGMWMLTFKVKEASWPQDIAVVVYKRDPT